MKRIVILGGGFGGVYTAIYLEKALRKELRKNEVEIVLINKNNYFVYQPMLAEVVGGTVGLFDTVSPLKRLLHKTKIYVQEIDHVDLKKKEVSLVPQFHHTSIIIPYDQLVIALGNVTDFRGNPGLSQHALPFKNLADALVIRNQIIDAIETAANETNVELQKQLLTFVIAGGGFSGMEVCAEVNDLTKKLCERYRIPLNHLSVVLVHGGTHLLDREMPESLGKYAARLLIERGVDIRFGKRLKTATPEEAILDDETRIFTKTIISSVPSSPHPLIEAMNLPKEKGKLKTTPFLQVEESDCIWALGDCAHIPLDSDSFCPPTAQFAVREAKRLALNLKAHLLGTEKKPFFYKALGMFGALGHQSAVAILFNRIQISGFFAWFMWRFIYWAKLPGFDRKIKTALSWFLDLLIPTEEVQLKIAPSQGITQLHFEPGDIIFNEGDVGDFLYIITDGEVEIYNKEGHLANLGNGEYFGEMALLKQDKRSATVKCVKPTNLLALGKKEFGALIANFSELRKNFEATDARRREKNK